MEKDYGEGKLRAIGQKAEHSVQINQKLKIRKEIYGINQLC